VLAHGDSSMTKDKKSARLSTLSADSEAALRQSGTARSEPDLSVVIAAWPNTRGLSSCLESLAAQRDDQVEVLVATSASADTKLEQRFNWVDWLYAPQRLWIPHLWSLGISKACGRIVAITTAHFVPDDDWIAQIRLAHARLDAAGIGGPIDPPRRGGPVEWATYYLRYSNYCNYRREQTVPEIAGDNASYKRDALQAHHDVIREGFWEPDFHRLLFGDGRTLAFVPEIRVRLATSFGFKQFCSQRLHHGRQFGAARLRGAGAAVRLTRIVSSPLIPGVLLAKIVGRVMRSGRDVVPFVLSLPVLAAFILAWTAGELWGYLSTKLDGGLVRPRRPVST
jgi:glycosyltransferase involved in cell wall biosynthesis